MKITKINNAVAILMLMACGSAAAQSGNPSIVGGSTLYNSSYGATTGWLQIWYDPAKYSGPGVCSAVLISPRIALTAAHCLYGSNNEKRAKYGAPYYIEFGFASPMPTGKIANTVPTTPPVYPSGTVYFTATAAAYPSSFFVGPLRNDEDNDIGLIVLDRDVTQSVSNIVPLNVASLPLDQSYVGLPAVAIGYGRTVGTDSSTNGTKYSTPLTIDDYGTYYANTFSWTYDESTGEGSGCNADSGGPVVYNGSHGYLLIGEIIGGGDNSSECQGDSVALDVGAHAGWIQKQVESWNNDADVLQSDPQAVFYYPVE